MSADLLPALQSWFRPGQWAETAVLSDILLAMDRDIIAALIFLDLTAAFDTEDLDILLQRLQMSFGVKDVVLQWF